MVRNTSLLGLVVLGVLVSLAHTPTARGQQVFSVRDPQTGRRYVADLSAHPKLMQEGRSITADLGRLQNRFNTWKQYAGALQQCNRTLFDRKAALARIQRRMNSIPTTIVSSSGDAATGSLNFRSSTNPELTRLRADYTVLSGKIRRAEQAVSAFRDQVNLERNRINEDFAAVTRRLDQWNRGVLALPNVKGQ